MSTVVRRAKRTRSKIKAHTKRPRLSVFKSNTAVYAQIIDDATASTITAASTKASAVGGMKAAAEATGKVIAEAAKKGKIVDVVFDRGAYKYTGVVKVFADAARAGGLNF